MFLRSLAGWIVAGCWGAAALTAYNGWSLLWLAIGVAIAVLAATYFVEAGTYALQGSPELNHDDRKLYRATFASSFLTFAVLATVGGGIAYLLTQWLFL